MKTLGVLLVICLMTEGALSQGECPKINFEAIHREIDETTVRISESLEIRKSYLSKMCEGVCDTRCELENLSRLTDISLKDSFAEPFSEYKEELAGLLIGELPRLVFDLHFEDVYGILFSELFPKMETPTQKIDLRARILPLVKTCEEFYSLTNWFPGDDYRKLDQFFYRNYRRFCSYYPLRASSSRCVLSHPTPRCGHGRPLHPSRR